MVLPTICINLLSMNSYIWFYEAILQINFEQIHANRCRKLHFFKSQIMMNGFMNELCKFVPLKTSSNFMND